MTDQLRAWWRNENYDREYMRRFRASGDYSHLVDLPDEVVARLAVFAFFAVHEAFREAWVAIKAAFLCRNGHTRDRGVFGTCSRCGDTTISEAVSDD